MGGTNKNMGKNGKSRKEQDKRRPEKKNKQEWNRREKERDATN